MIAFEESAPCAYPICLPGCGLPFVGFHCTKPTRGTRIWRTDCRIAPIYIGDKKTIAAIQFFLLHSYDGGLSTIVRAVF